MGSDAPESSTKHHVTSCDATIVKTYSCSGCKKTNSIDLACRWVRDELEPVMTPAGVVHHRITHSVVALSSEVRLDGRPTKKKKKKAKKRGGRDYEREPAAQDEKDEQGEMDVRE